MGEREADASEGYRRCLDRRAASARIGKRLGAIEGEVWRVTPGFLRYEISNLGSVRRVGVRGRQPKIFKRLDGRLAVRLTAGSETVTRSVQRLIEEAFGYPSHGFVIDADEGRRIGLPVAVTTHQEDLALRKMFPLLDVAPYIGMPSNDETLAEMGGGNGAKQGKRPATGRRAPRKPKPSPAPKKSVAAEREFPAPVPARKKRTQEV